MLFAGNDWQKNYIKLTFPDIETLPLEGYNVTYPHNSFFFIPFLLKQTPRLLHTIKKENQWLAKLVAARKIDAVIADNRYGLYHPEIPCVMMTHQLLVKTGMGAFFDAQLQKIHYRYINRFNECWAVDVAGKPNLSGDLAHPESLPKNIKYVGLLSQFAEEAKPDKAGKHILILLSGPEPQRSILSQHLWQQLQQEDGAVVFVEGSNLVSPKENNKKNIVYHTLRTKQEMIPLLQEASLVICRSGYSTLMDLAAFQKKAILIPTPGQTEQEYLGKQLHENGIFYCAPQVGFNLENALKAIEKFPFHPLNLTTGLQQYKTVISEWLQRLES